MKGEKIKKGENFNHPKKGRIMSVEPIRDLKKIAAIKRRLEGNPRNFALFVVGINTNLRASDFLNLKASQVRDIKYNETFLIRERKTKKPREVTFNRQCVDAIRNLLATYQYSNGDFLFKSQRGPALSTIAVNLLVKQWCREVNLKGNYGSHTLRKTWGYHQRVTFGVGLPELMEAMNHSTRAQTLKYLGVENEEIRSIFYNEI